MNRCTSCGIAAASVTASASASVTAPRRPPHRMTTLYLLSTRWLRPTPLNSGSSPNSTTARAANAAMTSTSRLIRSDQPTSSSSLGTINDASMKMSELAQNASCSHRSCRNRQSVGAIFGWPSALKARPAVTAATTPDTPSQYCPTMKTA